MHLVSERAKRHLSETAAHLRLTWDQRIKLKSVERSDERASLDQLKEIIPIIYIF